MVRFLVQKEIAPIKFPKLWHTVEKFDEQKDGSLIMDWTIPVKIDINEKVG